MATLARKNTYTNYAELLRLGGRPSAAIQADPGVWDCTRTDLELHELNHWTLEGMRVYSDLTRWKEFRNYQQVIRRSPEKFDKYNETLQQYRESENILTNVQLQLERQLKRQTKWDDWSKCYLYERRKRIQLEQIIAPVRQ